MAELSIFIDESGHFDFVRVGYYVLTLLLHEQRDDVAGQVAVLDTALKDLGFDGHVVHSGAAIRGEEIYRGMASPAACSRPAASDPNSYTVNCEEPDFLLEPDSPWQSCSRVTTAAER